MSKNDFPGYFGPAADAYSTLTSESRIQVLKQIQDGTDLVEIAEALDRGLATVHGYCEDFEDVGIIYERDLTPLGLRMLDMTDDMGPVDADAAAVYGAVDDERKLMALAAVGSSNTVGEIADEIGKTRPEVELYLEDLADAGLVYGDTEQALSNDGMDAEAEFGISDKGEGILWRTEEIGQHVRSAQAEIRTEEYVKELRDFGLDDVEILNWVKKKLED